MNRYTVGARVFCDFHFGRKPKAVCVEVIEPGDGRGKVRGKVRVRVLQACGAYHKGEMLELPAWQAVPHAQELAGGFYRRVSTDFVWEVGGAG